MLRPAWEPRTWELQALAFALLLAAALLAAALILKLGAVLMRRLPIVIALTAAAVVLSGCASFGGASGAGAQILQNLEGCDRHYEGAIGAGVNGSFRIDCKARPAVAAPAAEPTA